MSFWGKKETPNFGVCATCNTALSHLFLNGDHHTSMRGKRYCSQKCYNTHFNTASTVIDSESQRESEHLDFLESKFDECETDEQWRRASGGWSKQSVIEDAKYDLRKIRSQEKAERETELEAERKAEKKKQDEIDDRRRDKEYEQEKRKLEQMKRDDERKKERDERELKKEQEKARKQQEADALKQAEEERWKPRHFKP
jgi:hypothetical protein